MLNQLRGAAARIPLVGPAFKRVYLTLFAGEGRVRPIQRGLLAGMRYYQYRWSTPREDLVETNWADPAAEAFVQLVAGKRRIFDVGANWGFYVLLAHKHRDAGCEIVAFEPHPQSAKELRTQIVLNEVTQATVVPAALSDRAGAIEFVDTGSAIGQKVAAVDKDFGWARRISLPAITLDEAAEKYGAPDLIKLDVEGAENLVLEGGKRVLTEQRPTLLVEVHGEECAGRFYDLMDQYGYRYETTGGAAIADRAYHHHLICRPNSR
jgi:FkbM family methyltransferase